MKSLHHNQIRFKVHHESRVSTDAAIILTAQFIQNQKCARGNSSQVASFIMQQKSKETLQALRSSISREKSPSKWQSLSDVVVLKWPFLSSWLHAPMLCMTLPCIALQVCTQQQQQLELMSKRTGVPCYKSNVHTTQPLSTYCCSECKHGVSCLRIHLFFDDQHNPFTVIDKFNYAWLVANNAVQCNNAMIAWGF